MLDPDDLVPQISHSKGLCWDSLSFRLRDGRHRRVAGIRRAEAQTLGRMLEAWVAPVRERFFADLERKLQATEALVAPLLDGSTTSGTARSWRLWGLCGRRSRRSRCCRRCRAGYLGWWNEPRGCAPSRNR